MRVRSGLMLAAAMTLAACVPSVEQRPAAPPHRPATPPPAPPAQPQPIDWQDWPVTPGDWSYARDDRSSIARFGAVGAPVAWVRCDLAAHAVSIGRAVQGPPGGSAMLTLRTSFGVLQWPVRATASPVPGIEAARASGDAGLDQIAFSRGRFTLELPGAPPLVLPTWAEPVRVVEDCRG